MNRWTNLLKPQAEAGLRLDVGAIPGLEIERITAMPPQGCADVLDVVVSLRGWSPCLNLLQMRWTAIVGADDDAERHLHDLREQSSRRLEVQRARQLEGMSLGRASPFDVTDEDGHRDDTQIAHILVDPALADMIGHGDALIREVGNTVWDLHYDLRGDTDGTEERMEGEQTAEYGEPSPGLHGFAGRLFVFEMPLGDAGMVYDGLRIKVPGDLPDTLLAACCGRLVREVVDVAAPVGDRTVVGAERADDGGTVLTLKPEPLTVEGIVGPGMTR